MPPVSIVLSALRVCSKKRWSMHAPRKEERSREEGGGKSKEAKRPRKTVRLLLPWKRESKTQFKTAKDIYGIPFGLQEF